MPLPRSSDDRRSPDIQERCSLRCAPQVLGAVRDRLDLQGSVLLDETAGRGDNPVLVDGTVLHGGNVHAAPLAFACETHASCAHQVACLLERQFALVPDPAVNGGLPPLLTPRPGAGSGFGGVQMPLALNSANAVAEMTERIWRILGWLLLAVDQLAHLSGHRDRARGRLWRELREEFPPVDQDRPLAQEITRAAGLARIRFLPLTATDRYPDADVSITDTRHTIAV